MGSLEREHVNLRLYIQNIVNKFKKRINILLCLAGIDWGVNRTSLRRIYSAVIRPTIDYGSNVYSSTSASQIKKVESIQPQALRICCGAFKTSTVADALQVGMEEMPLVNRGQQLKMVY